MSTLIEIKARISQVLEDPAGRRYESGLLDEAVRLALDTLDQRLPLILSSEVTASGDGRDQCVAGLSACLYLVSLRVQRSGHSSGELEPESEFSYQFDGEQLRLHFAGRWYPQSGDGLRVTYAAGHRIQGLDGAEATTLPMTYESALVSGAAGHACLLRATHLAEAYGARPEEATRLMQISKLRLDDYGRTLGALKTLQEFGFPPGFGLDEEDVFGKGRW